MRKILDKIILLLSMRYDGYVPYFWPSHSLLGIARIENIKLIRWLRVTYWHKKCREYPPFSPFFNEKILNSFLGDNEYLAEESKEIYEKGIARITTNLLDSNELNDLKNLIDKIDLKKNNLGYVQFEMPGSLAHIRKKLIERLYPVYRDFFPVPHRLRRHERIYVGIRIDFSDDGEDKSPATANWHADRFVPTINAIYFPFGATWGAFEKDVGNPVITGKDFEYFLSRRRLKKGIQGAVRDSLYVDLGREKQIFTAEPNTMVVGTHHLQHRRSPISEPGRRVAIFIDHYNFFTLKDLLNGNLVES